MSKVFVDTNLLAYAMDESEPEKRAACRARLRELDQQWRGVISTQVLQEFYVVATKKLKVEPSAAKGIVQRLEQQFDVVVINPALIHEAIDCSILSQVSFWDALILVAAESAKCGVVWTEDIPAAERIRGVEVINPLTGR